MLLPPIFRAAATIRQPLPAVRPDGRRPLPRPVQVACAVACAGALATVATACASSSSTTTLGGQTRTTQTLVGVTGAQAAVGTFNEDDTRAEAIDASPDAVWRVLPGVITTLGLPITTQLQEERLVESKAFRTRRRVEKVPMYRALDCGGESGMPNAETYDITLDVSAKVTQSGFGGALLQTLVTATARRPTSGNAAPVNCRTLGAIEKRILELVKAAVAKQQP